MGLDYIFINSHKVIVLKQFCCHKGSLFSHAINYNSQQIWNVTICPILNVWNIDQSN